MEWNSSMEVHFCEGIQIPYLVPGVFEFFSMLTSIPIMILGLVGFFQGVVDLPTKLCYASMSLSGFGSILLHSRRIAAFNLADTFPILVTFVIAFSVFAEEFLLHYLGNSPPRWKRALCEIIIYVGAIGYLIFGLIIQIYPPIPSIFGYYFGIPMSIGTIFSTTYIYLFYRRLKKNRPEPWISEEDEHIPVMSCLSLGVCLMVIPLKLIDTIACNEYTVWLFAHSCFHITQVYGSWCLLILITLFKSVHSMNPQNRKYIKIVWMCKGILPFIEGENRDSEFFDFKKKLNFKSSVYFCILSGLGKKNNSERKSVDTNEHEYQVMLDDDNSESDDSKDSLLDTDAI